MYDRDCPNNNVKLDNAYQFIYQKTSQKLRVAFAGGREYFLDESMKDDEDKPGIRTDGLNLIEKWKILGPKIGDYRRKYVYDRNGLLSINPSKKEQILGLFAANHLPFHYQYETENLTHIKPTLSEMVEKAIDILSEDEKGFFLFVEGGLIDVAHHRNRPKVAIDETAELSKAVKLARDKLSTEDTLIVVSADHSHVMTIAGYPPRHNNIFAYSSTAVDTQPALTLSYANGPGFKKFYESEQLKRKNVMMMDSNAWDFVYPSGVDMFKETHGGDDVPVYASGPFEHLFGGSYEQNTIPILMAYAMCIGDGPKVCDENN